MQNIFILGAVSLITLYYLITAYLNKKEWQSDLKEFRSYIDDLVNFEPTQINIGKDQNGKIDDALLFDENNKEIMVIQKNNLNEFIHLDFDFKELIKSEIRVNGLVISSIHCNSITQDKFRDLEKLLDKEITARTNVKTMEIRVYLKKDSESFTYDIPLINSKKFVDSQHYSKAKLQALHWQYAFSKQCMHESISHQSPIQLRIESLQEELSLADSVE